MREEVDNFKDLGIDMFPKDISLIKTYEILGRTHGYKTNTLLELIQLHKANKKIMFLSKEENEETLLKMYECLGGTKEDFQKKVDVIKNVADFNVFKLSSNDVYDLIIFDGINSMFQDLDATRYYIIGIMSIVGIPIVYTTNVLPTFNLEDELIDFIDPVVNIRIACELKDDKVIYYTDEKIFTKTLRKKDKKDEQKRP